MRRSWLFFLVPLCLAGAGCAPPFFDALDAAAGLTRQMTPVGSVGSLSLDSNSTDVRFLPARSTASAISDLKIQSGFVLHTQGAYQYLEFVSLGSNGTAQSTGWDNFSLANVDPNLPTNEYVVTASLGNPAVFVFLYNSGSSTFKLDVADPAANTLTFGTLTSFSSLFPSSGYPIAGAPLPGAGSDSLEFLLNNAGTLSEGPASLNAPQTGLTAGTVQALGSSPIPAPSTQNRVLSFYNPTTALGYASYLVSGSWQTVSYTSTGSPTVLSGVTHPLAVVLTTGDLVSTDGGVLRLYDSGGNLLRSAALNGLRLCYEAYVGSTPYVFFSLPMVNARRDWSFLVYVSPSSSMRSLSG
jgi:hypothetical protein